MNCFLFCYGVALRRPIPCIFASHHQGAGEQVSSSLAATAEAFAETPLASVGSMLCRMSMSLSRGLSQEVTRWPFSDSIPTTYFACPGPAGFRVRGGNYLKDRKKVRSWPISMTVTITGLVDICIEANRSIFQQLNSILAIKPECHPMEDELHVCA